MPMRRSVRPRLLIDTGRVGRLPFELLLVVDTHPSSEDPESWHASGVAVANSAQSSLQTLSRHRTKTIVE